MAHTYTNSLSSITRVEELQLINHRIRRYFVTGNANKVTLLTAFNVTGTTTLRFRFKTPLTSSIWPGKIFTKPSEVVGLRRETAFSRPHHSRTSGFYLGVWGDVRNHHRRRRRQWHIIGDAGLAEDFRRELLVTTPELPIKQLEQCKMEFSPNRTKEV